MGGRTASVEDVEALNQGWEDVTVSGGAFTLGGGLYTYFTETFALEVAVKFSGGRFTEVDLGPLSVDNLDIDAESARFKVGVVWWP